MLYSTLRLPAHYLTHLILHGSFDLLADGIYDLTLYDDF